MEELDVTRLSARRFFPFSARRSTWGFGSLLIFVLAFLVACGSEQASLGPGVPSGARPAAPAAAPTAAPAAAAPVPAPNNARGAVGAVAQAPAATASNGNPSTTQPANPATGDTLPPLDRMVIRDAKLTLQVQDVEAALLKVREIADTNGGYVTASHTYYVKDGDKDEMVADVTIAVRSDTYDRAVESIRQTAVKVENEDGTSQDVTDQYVDLQANLRNLQASEDALLKLDAQATRLEDILTLERELANVRGQIEHIQGQLRVLDNRTSMSTISVNLHLPPVVAAPPPPAPVWTPLMPFERGWQASLQALQAIADVLITVVSFSWWLVPFVVAGLLALRRMRPPATTG
jgi:hypothetical protein